MKGFWYVIQGYKALLVRAANKEAANAKFKVMHPGITALYSCGATFCGECCKFVPPIDRDVQKLHYPEAQPCDCGHQRTTHFLGNAVNDIANPLSPAQIN